MVIAASVVQVSLDGSHCSAWSAGAAASLNPGELVPPVARTVPSGSSVALSWRRATDIGATSRHDGVAAVRSITSVLALGTREGGLKFSRGLPPTISTLPGSYMTEEPYSRRPKWLAPTGIHEPLSRVSRYQVFFSGPAQNTRPPGTT